MPRYNKIGVAVVKIGTRCLIALYSLHPIARGIISAAGNLSVRAKLVVNNR